VANPFDDIAAGLGEREADVTLPEPRANPFDTIGALPEREPVLSKITDYKGAEVLQDPQGQWYVRSEAKGLEELTPGAVEEIQKELGGVEAPWVDPLLVAGGAGGVTTRLARKAGAGVVEALGRGAVAATVAGTAEFPIGTATEIIAEDHPGLALPFNLAVGVLSGVTIERAIEKAVTRGLAKGASKTVVKAKTTAVRKALEADDLSDPVTRNVADEINERLRVAKAPKSAEEAAEAFNPFDNIGKKPIKPEPGDVAAGGLAYGTPLPKRVQGLNFNRIGAEYDAKKYLLDIIDQNKPLMQAAKQGKRTHIATREAAQTLADRRDMNVDKLIEKLKTKTEDLDAYLVAARDAETTAINELTGLRKLYVQESTEENLGRLILAQNRMGWVASEITGASSKTARALQAQRIQSIESNLLSRNYQKMFEAAGGKEMSEEIAKRLALIDPNDSTAVARFIGQVTKAPTPAQVFEAWVNGLLSGLQTHVANATSNTLTFLSVFPERGIGVTLDLFRAGVTRTPRERFYGELPEHMYGAWHGLKEGVRAGLRAFSTEIPSVDAMKLEMPRKMAIPSKVFREGVAKKKIGKFAVPFTGELELGGKQVRIPGRALIAMDEFFKAINYRAELHSLAFRQAAREGKKGPARVNRIAEIVSDPTDQLKEKATQEMLYRVFQKELGPTGKALTKLRTVTPGLKYIIPFLKTPTNIAKFGLERTPLSVARYPGMFRKLMKGELTGAEITDDMAKTIMGSMIGLGTFMYAREGLVTGGGPKNKQDREALYRTGWQPYSLKVGDKYYSYGRLEPLGILMGTAADASEIWDAMESEEQENVAALISLSVAKNLTSKTFMKGLSDTMNAATDPVRFGDQWVQNFAGTVVPSGIAATARAIDPELKEVQTIVDKVKSRIPGLTEGIATKRDIWGRAIERDLSGVAAMVTPVYVSAGRGSKADSEISRLKLRIGKPSKKIGDTELTPEQYDRLMVAGGTAAEERILAFVNRPHYDKLKDSIKARMIEKYYRSSMDLARSRMKNELRRQRVE
jgi:hypothetical protein